MKLAVPDMISNSYFPAIAAIELGFFKQEGLDVALELIFPVDKAYQALREGAVDFVGGSAHSALAAFPQWQGVKLLCAQAQGMYWFLVMRADLGAKRGDVEVGQGPQHRRRALGRDGAASPAHRGGDRSERDGVQIAPVPGALGAGVNFGVTAAKALEECKIDGFWANGMGAEVAVRRGVGTMVLDVRRGDGPKACFNYTMASIATTDAPDRARRRRPRPQPCARSSRPMRRSKKMSSSRPSVGRKLFPPSEAELIAELIRRDLPYYDASISRDFVAGMNQFARDVGILKGQAPYESVVATRFSDLWAA